VPYGNPPDCLGTLGYPSGRGRGGSVGGVLGVVCVIGVALA